MESLPSTEKPFDPSKPFDGLVLCCTSVEADLRTEIAQRTVDLGGIHKYDLTPDVTHLVVGDYNTAKYRHVARERPDIKPMAAGWVNAVRELWLEDKEFDFDTLEDSWRLKTFETGGGIPNSPIEEQRPRTRLMCCLTGFEDADVRSMIEDKVRENGGDYVGDLSRRVTHLIVCKPEGKKYIAARKWEIRTVSIEWLYDSIERGMILNEDCYDPTLPQEERGKGAWTRRDPKRVSLGKRSRDSATAPPADDGRRKLRKTASMKLISQRDTVWCDILVKQSATDLSSIVPAPDERPASVPNLPATDPIAPAADGQQLPQQSNRPPQTDSGVFSSCRFYVHGFSWNRQEVVHHHIASHGGQISQSIEDVASPIHTEPLDRRYLVVPQSSQPDSHPELSEGMYIVTEFYIERCVHNKVLFKPADHVLGQPFPQFPIEGFSQLTICTSGFRNEQLNQVEKAIVQLGAKYSERLNSQCSLLICPSLDGVRKQKLDFAMLSKVPVVSADWLWQCIAIGCLVPWERFLLMGSSQKIATKPEAPRTRDKDEIPRSKPEPTPREKPKTDPLAPIPRSGIDMTAFEDDMHIPQMADLERQESEASHYETAPTRQTEGVEIDPELISAPLSEKTPNALNKSPSPQNGVAAPRKLKRFPTGGEIGDSESDEDSGTPVDQPEKEDIIAKDEAEEGKRQVVRAKVAEREELSKHLKSLVNDKMAQDGYGMKPQPAPRQRRKREILGRAASNVSAASSASTESSTHMSSSKPIPKRSESLVSRLDSAQGVADGLGLLDKMMMENGGEGNQETKNGDNPPRSTQLEYDNPEARKHRAAVLNRMMSNGEQDGSGDSKPSQEKGLSESLQGGAQLGMNAAGPPARRTTRRR
ncbi:protein kinase activating protein dpb11 [Parahypoxylon ruwenzoriense]